MKNKIILGIVLISTFGVFSITSARTVRVRSYYKPSTGNYVMSSHRTSPNKTKLDNYSTKGNYNPYSGKIGKVKAY